MLYTVIGMNSGSAFDGIDAVVMQLDVGSDDMLTRPEIVDTHSLPWPRDIAALVVEAFGDRLPPSEIGRLNYLTGGVFADLALEMMRRNHLEAHDVTVIGFDGQTISLAPRELGERDPDLRAYSSMADPWRVPGFGHVEVVGEAAVVAVACNVPTVTRFRPIDHALGGTGAPMVQFLDYVCFRDVGPVVTLNIGGIANCQFVVPSRDEMIAFDTGPGNVMLNHVVRQRLDREYDDAGSMAARGAVIPAMLEELRGHPFLRTAPPRNAWRTTFGHSYTDDLLERWADERTEDLLATLVEFTAEAVQTSCARYIPGWSSIPHLVVSGGGLQNAFLVSRIQALVPGGMKVVASDQFGIPAQYKEAMQHGILGLSRWLGLSNNVPSTTGATGFGVMGQLTLPPRLGALALHCAGDDA